MKILTGFLEPSEGRAAVNGFFLDEDLLQVQRSIGYLPEHNPLYTDMYVKEYLYFVAGLHKVPDAKKRVAEIIQTVGLGVEQNKKIEELSKGYRQRVGLAQALIHDPHDLPERHPPGCSPRPVRDGSVTGLVPGGV